MPHQHPSDKTHTQVLPSSTSHARPRSQRIPIKGSANTHRQRPIKHKARPQTQHVEAPGSLYLYRTPSANTRTRCTHRGLIRTHCRNTVQTMFTRTWTPRAHCAMHRQRVNPTPGHRKQTKPTTKPITPHCRELRRTDPLPGQTPPFPLPPVHDRAYGSTQHHTAFTV